jgi:hypothetical protein
MSKTPNNLQLPGEQFSEQFAQRESQRLNNEAGNTQDNNPLFEIRSQNHQIQSSQDNIRLSTGQMNILPVLRTRRL